jgi:hypothetical protein
VTALHVVADDDPDGLTLDAWNQVVDHIKACWPYSRPWPVDTQQAFYDVLKGFSREELIGGASRLAKSTVRRNSRDWRERPALAELREAAASERAELKRIHDEVRLRVVDTPWTGWKGMAIEPPDETAGPYYRLAYAMSRGEIDPGDHEARDAFVLRHGGRFEGPLPYAWRNRV